MFDGTRGAPGSGERVQLGQEVTTLCDSKAVEEGLGGLGDILYIYIYMQIRGPIGLQPFDSLELLHGPLP